MGTEIRNANEIVDELKHSFSLFLVAHQITDLSNVEPTQICHSMEPFEIHCSNIFNLSCCKSVGPNKLHPFLLEEVAESTAKPLSRLFKVPLCTKEVQTDWKTALFTPLFKKGYKGIAENCHSLSITFAVAKILERMVNDSVMKHLKLNRVLLQHGFQPCRKVSRNRFSGD